MKNKFALFTVAVYLVGGVCHAYGQLPASSEFNTGNNGNGGVLAAGSNDLHWLIAVDSITAPYVPAVVMIPNGLYIHSPWPDAQWISDNIEGDPPYPQSEFFFKTSFNLPATDSCGKPITDYGSFCLSFDMYADNCVWAVYINGDSQSLGQTYTTSTGPYGNYGFISGGNVTANFCNNWVAGTNEIIVYVKSQAATEMGFLCQASVFTTPPPFAPDLNIAPPPVLSCSTSEVTLSALSSTPGVVYQWEGGPEDSDYTVTRPGLYFVTVTDTISHCGGYATDSVRVFQNSSGKATAINVNPADTAICAGQSVHLTVISSDDSTLHYLWSTGDTTSTIVVTPAQNSTYIVSAKTNLSGCTSIDSATIQIKPLPVASITASSPIPFCRGDSAILSTPAGYISYLWNNGDTSNKITVRQPGIYRVAVTGECGVDTSQLQVTTDTLPPVFTLGDDTTYCGNFNLTLATGNANTNWSTGVTGAQIAISNSGLYWASVSNACGASTDTIEIGQVFKEYLPILGNDTTVCTSDSLVLDAYTPGATYRWQNNSTLATYTVTQSGTYQVLVSVSGCTISDSVSINIFSPSPVTISENPPIICSGDSSQICAPVGYLGYQWNTGSTGMCFFAKEAGYYYVTVTDNNHCTVESSPLSLSVYPVSSVSIVVEGDTLSSFGAVSYQWYLNGNEIAGATTPFYIAQVAGLYSIGITDTNGCYVISDQVNISVAAGINEPGEEKVEVYPNPANQIIIISNLSAGTPVVITNLLGETVIKELAINKLQIIDVSLLPAGMYFVNKWKFIKE